MTDEWTVAWKELPSGGGAAPRTIKWTAWLPCRFSIITTITTIIIILIIIITGVSRKAQRHFVTSNHGAPPDVSIQEVKVLVFCLNLWSCLVYIVWFVLCSARVWCSQWDKTEQRELLEDFTKAKKHLGSILVFSGWLEDFLPAGTLSNSKGMMVNTYMELWVRKWAEKKKRKKKKDLKRKNSLFSN